MLGFPLRGMVLSEVANNIDNSKSARAFVREEKRVKAEGYKYLN